MQIRLGFFGAAQNVTGSRYFVEANGVRLLVDCGLHQEREFRGRDWDAFPVAPETLDAVLLTHAHLDHSGFLPRLVRDGFRGRIFCTAATADVAKIILLDSAHIQEEDAEFKKKRHSREGRRGAHPEVPLYTAHDARATFPLFSPVVYQKAVRLGEGVEATFHDAGHVLGSAMVRLKVTQADGERTLLFSGDVGQWDKPILCDPTLFDQADYVLVESTYGDRQLERWEDVDGVLAEAVNTTVESGGNLLIPSFAFERAQQVLYRLNRLLLQDRIPHLMVFLDSPMAVSVTECFERHEELLDEDTRELMRRHQSPFDFPGLKLVRTIDESKAINRIKGTAIIIAGSGMCTAGRIKHHLVTNISRPESTILFVGYQATGTLGRQIAGGAREVRILGRQYKVRARVIQLHGLSSHADRAQLLKWVSSLREAPRRVFVTHGEPESAQALADLIRAEKGWPVEVPRYGEEVTLD